MGSACSRNQSSLDRPSNIDPTRTLFGRRDFIGVHTNRRVVEDYLIDRDLGEGSFAQVKLEMEQIKAMNQPAPAQVSVNNDTNGTFAEGLKSLMEQQQNNMQQIAELLSRPKQIVRGSDGRAVGVQ